MRRAIAWLRFQWAAWRARRHGHTACRGCLREVDEKWCWCGSHVDRHGMFDNHAPVAMGCLCHMERQS